MQRYFLDSDNGIITGADAHHIINVMRGKNDDQIIVCHNECCYLSKIIIDNKQVIYTKLTKLPDKKQLLVDIYQGLPKGNKVDLIAKSATIFGARALYFVPMKRSIAKLANEEHKMKRYGQIIKEAAELAGRNNLMTVNFLQSLMAIDFSSYDLILLADENHLDNKISNYLTNDRNLKVALIIGPEGGIDEVERQMLIERNTKLISLGSLIIPTELAHIAALNLIYDRID